MSTGGVDVFSSSHEIEQYEREMLRRIQSFTSPMLHSTEGTSAISEGVLHDNNESVFETTNSNGSRRVDFSFNGTSSTAHPSQPSFESLVETLRENRQAQLASAEQQRKVLTYMEALDESLQHDVRGRQTELNNIVSLVEQLNNRLHNLTSTLQDYRLSGEANTTIESEPPHEHPKSSATSIISPTPTSELESKKILYEVDPSVSSTPSGSLDSVASGITKSRHPTSQIASPRPQDLSAAASSTDRQSQETFGSTTITIGPGTNSREDQPTVKIVIQNPAPAQQASQQSVPLSTFPGPSNPWGQFPMFPPPPGAPNFSNPYYGIPPIPGLYNIWGFPPPPFVTPLPHVPPKPSGGWYAAPTPLNIPPPASMPYPIPHPGLPIVPAMDGRFFSSAYPQVVPQQVNMIPTPVVQPQVVEHQRTDSRSHSRAQSRSPRRSRSLPRTPSSGPILPNLGRSPDLAPYDDIPNPVVPPAADPNSYSMGPPRSPPHSVPPEHMDYSTADYNGYRAPLPSTLHTREGPFPTSVSDPEPRWETEAIQQQAFLEAEFSELKGMIQHLLEKKEDAEQAKEKEKEEEPGPRLQSILRVDKSVIEFTKIIAVSVLLLVLTDFIRARLTGRFE